MVPRRLLLTPVGAVLPLAGCGSPKTSDEGHGTTDARFAQPLIAHHESRPYG